MQPEGGALDRPENWWDVRYEDEPFLTKAEWGAYRNRPPVRYTGKKLKQYRRHNGICEFCDGPETEGNPLQAAHLISFSKGVQHLALTPEFLDHQDRMKWAHRKDCNDRVEYGFVETLRYLRDKVGIGTLPPFLRPEVLRAWDACIQEERGRPERRA